jgi:hypothetical protein
VSDEDLAMLALLEFLDACETGVAAAKHLIREAKIGNQLEETWLPEKICWEKAEGASGPYERSEDFNSLDFKAMLKDLEAHEGKARASCSSHNYCFGLRSDNNPSWANRVFVGSVKTRRSINSITVSIWITCSLGLNIGLWDS